MAIDKVREYLKKYNRDKDIQEFNTSSATVELAAKALGVIPSRIAKTMSFKDDNGCILVVTSGDAKIDNSKFKKQFKIKAKMIPFEEVESFTGHEVGGVCPFANPNNTKVYLDISMKRFDTVFPACGSQNSAIELNLDDLFTYSKAIEWIDVSKEWE